MRIREPLYALGIAGACAVSATAQTMTFNLTESAGNVILTVSGTFGTAGVVPSGWAKDNLNLWSSTTSDISKPNVIEYVGVAPSNTFLDGYYWFFDVFGGLFGRWGAPSGLGLLGTAFPGAMPRALAETPRGGCGPEAPAVGHPPKLPRFCSGGVGSVLEAFPMPENKVAYQPSRQRPSGRPGPSTRREHP